MHPYARINDDEEAGLEASTKRLDHPQLALGLVDPTRQRAPQPVQSTPTPVDGPAELAARARGPVHLALFRLGNPYATDYYFPPDEGVEAVPSMASAERKVSGITKDAFRQRCEAIFRPYVPQLERGGKLRLHHREFIARNESRSASIRQRIVEALEKYSLSSIPGLAPQFNREDDGFARGKLASIEESVLRSDE